MEEKLTQYHEIIKGSRKLIKKETHTSIYDPRIKNYPDNHPMMDALRLNGSDWGAEWILVPNELLDATEAILDSYPEEFSEVKE